MFVSEKAREVKGMAQWNVVLPIAGNVEVSVEAQDENSAIETALEIATLDDVSGWEALREFNQGNVCYCPHPWEAEATIEDDGEE